MNIVKLISGGQTGVDRAALDAAITLGIPHGGWCPKGCIAEDGTISERYNLQETPTSDYAERTEWNVRDSDGTLIIAEGALTGGTKLTMELAKQYHKPYFIFDPSQPKPISEIVSWIDENNISVLNLAGPRASKSDRIYSDAFNLLNTLLGHF